MERTIKTNYWFGDIVYLRVNDDKKKGMVVGLNLRPNAQVLYSVSWSGCTETWHHEMELTSEYMPDYAEPSQVKEKKSDG